MAIDRADFLSTVAALADKLHGNPTLHVSPLIYAAAIDGFPGARIELPDGRVVTMRCASRKH